LPDAIGLRLAADDDTSYTVRIRRGQIAPLIIEILGQADRLPPESDRRQIELASSSAIGADTVVDLDGRPGISMRLAGGPTLSLAASVWAARPAAPLSAACVACWQTDQTSIGFFSRLCGSSGCNHLFQGGRPGQRASRALSARSEPRV